MFTVCSRTFWLLFCALLSVSSEKCRLRGVMDGGGVTDSPHTGLVLIISSKILPTAAGGMAGHAAISSCDQKGQVRAEWTLEHQLGSIFCSAWWFSYNRRTYVSIRDVDENPLGNSYLSLSQSTDTHAALCHRVLWCRIIVKHVQIIKKQAAIRSR